jgi:hypothetical protein
MGNKIRIGECNPLTCSTHKGCVLPETYRLRQKLWHWYCEEKAHQLAQAARMCRLAAFIQEVANSRTKPTNWDECIHPGFRAKSKKWEIILRDLQTDLNTEATKYLTFVKEKAVPDILKWHPVEEERLKVALKIFEDVFFIPAPCIFEWFKTEVQTGMVAGGKNAISQIIPWGKIAKSALWDTYKKIVVNYSPMLLALAGKLPREQMFKLATNVLVPEKLFGPKAVTCGSFEIPLYYLASYDHKAGIAIVQEGERLTGSARIRMVQFKAANHLYHIPVISGILASIALVFTLQDLAKDKSVRNWLKTTAGACSVGGAVTDMVVARALRFKGIAERITTGERVPYWGVASKILNRGAYALTAAAGFGEAADFFGAGNPSAALCAFLGIAGSLLMMIPGVGWTIAGIIVTVGGAIGVGLCADEELARWAKQSPYGTAPEGYSALDSEKKLEEILYRIRCRAADACDAQVREIRRYNSYMLLRLQLGKSPFGDGPKTALDEQDAAVKCKQNEKLANSKVLEAWALRKKWEPAETPLDSASLMDSTAATARLGAPT